MNLLPIFTDVIIPSNYPSSINLDPHPPGDTEKRNHDKPAALGLNDPALQFALVLAHEVRNPLTNITLSIEMLESAINDQELKIYLDIIKRNSIRINDLINEFFKSQQTDKMPAEKYSVHQLLDEVLAMAEDQIRLKNISVRREYDPQDCEMIFNLRKMKIALTNIIVNAIDAMTAVKGQLMVVTRSGEDKYVIEIRDNGCGISKDNLGNIFKRYYTNKPGGLGLGLATTYDILRSNHVEVNVESEEGLGTQFILLFNKNLPIESLQ
jgi:signal transduction histidine kinase